MDRGHIPLVLLCLLTFFAALYAAFCSPLCVGTLASLWIYRRHVHMSRRRAFPLRPETGVAAPDRYYPRLTITSINCCLWPRGLSSTPTINTNKDDRTNQVMIPRLLSQADVTLCQEVFGWPFISNTWRCKMGKFLSTSHIWAPQDRQAMTLHHMLVRVNSSAEGVGDGLLAVFDKRGLSCEDRADS